MKLSGKRILVTGADGFIGSHLVERLISDGHKTRALCFYNSNGSHGWLDELGETASDVDLCLGDIRDGGLVDSLCKDVDVVLNLAALIAIPYSYQAPRSYLETNVLGTLNVLEAVRRHDIEKLIHTSTSEVYGTPDSVPITELHPLKAQSPYSASKIGADKLCESFALSFDTPVSILRPFNTFGPRQSLRAVIPTVLSQMLTGQRQVRIGNTRPERDFTFVADTVDGFVKAASTDLKAGETIQLGTGKAVSIAELVDICKDVTGSSCEIVTEEARLRPDASEVDVLLSDPTIAQLKLGWKPTVDLRDGLTLMAEWLKGHMPANPHDYRQ